MPPLAPPPAVLRSRAPLNVKDYGARGDGVGDDAAAIQAAITAATGVGGGAVFFPQGVYRVGTRIALAPKVNLLGSGREFTTIRASAGVSTSVLIGLSGDAITDVRIRDLRLDGDYSSSALSLAGIQITNGARIVVQDVAVTNVAKGGILYTTCTDSDVLDCDISYTGQGQASTGFGVLLTDGNRCAVRRNRFTACNGMNIGGNTNATNAAVDDNICDHTLCPSTTVSGAGQNPAVSGTLNVVSTAGFPPSGTLSVAGIVGAVLYTGLTATSFIGCSGASGTATDGGVARNGYESIGFTSGCNGWVVKGNRSINSGDNGISASASFCVVEGNWIDSPQFHGILLGGDHCVIAGNWVHNPGQAIAGQYSGFRVSNGSNSIISNNRFYDSQDPPTMKSGITELNDSTDMTYWGNRITGVTVTEYALASSATSQKVGPVGITSVTVSGSTTVATDAANATYRKVTVTTTSAFTMGAPINPHVCARVTYDFVNSSGGAMGAITWNAVFKLAGALTNPASGSRRMITFIFDGTNWVETGRSAADI